MKSLCLSVDELMQVKAESIEQGEKKDINRFVNLVLKGVALAMGVATAILSILHEIDTQSAMGMLGIGLACLAIVSLQNKAE